MHDLSKASWPAHQGELFKERHTAMLAIHAELAAFEMTPAYDNDRHDEISERFLVAQKLVMTTHAPRDWMVWQKIQIFEDALHGAGECEWTDNRQVWMFACIKADLMAHGIGG